MLHRAITYSKTQIRKDHDHGDRLVSGSDTNDERMCWICLTSHEEMPRNDWIHPCRCRGTNKWVHDTCLSRWIDEKQMLSPDSPVTCMQCRTEYIILMPKLCRFDSLLQRIDKWYGRLCPSVLVGILAATVYFSAVTYGALTLLEVAGYDAGIVILQEDATLLMIVLPAIPTVLLLSRLIRWDDLVIRLLRRQQRQLLPPEHLDEDGNPLPGAPLGDAYFEEQEREHSSMDVGNFGSSMHVGRASVNFCIALSLPTFAVILGKIMYQKVENRSLSILLGGLTFIAIKGLAGIYLRLCKHAQKRKRFVLDFTADNIWRLMSSNRTSRHRSL
ncbi:uncharacterized protein Dwil_GK19914 [Drosophila willistoni]|uniref:E3 ubiquitin-protein ligase MARCHF5 n=1 Tax=Drosophila willistoni TaxID=7260 RepID=B4MSF3_DROWI|nr:E3 ubiquitin-protein ligase MARCHF5 [Drosophila willistoni]EDW75042.1 uncharacterized protein Dwil_GK19914 [Drosophila willistoni]